MTLDDLQSRGARHAQGALEFEAYKGVRMTLARIACSPGGASWWRRTNHVFSPDFVAFVEQDRARFQQGPDRGGHFLEELESMRS